MLFWMKAAWSVVPGLCLINGTRKAPGALEPAVVLPPSGRKKLIKVTQDTSPSPCSERHGKYLSGRAKARRLGVSDHEKRGKQETPQGHWTPPFFSSSQGAKYVTVTQHTSPRRVNFKVGDLSYL